ncbi:MAG TPA: ECF transporter S component [Clostridiaceae bacterium]|nr:ECF transporter S component [Clostridiaceae bacterium]
MSTKKLVLNGVMIALVFLATRLISIPGPIPPGIINLGDSVIMITAILLGARSGFVAGALGSALADITFPGGFVFAPVTFVVKGLEGYIVGMVASGSEKEGKNFFLKSVVAVIIGAIVMVAGYFLAEAFVLSMFDTTFGYTFAVTELPFNLAQGCISAIVSYILSILLNKANIRDWLD